MKTNKKYNLKKLIKENKLIFFKGPLTSQWCVVNNNKVVAYGLISDAPEFIRKIYFKEKR